MELFVHDSPADVAARTASLIAESIADKSGPFSLGLAGGSSPKPTYDRLREIDVAWPGVHAWLGDERWVPHDSDRSNGRMASDSLFSHVPASLVRPDYGDDPEAAASAYEQELGEIEAMAGRHDIVILGLGDDGHTASLFPGSAALAESDRKYVANRIPETGEIRLTATYPLLHDAARVIFIVTGRSKAEALEASLAGETPAGKVGQGRATVEWHVDRDAASLLS